MTKYQGIKLIEAGRGGRGPRNQVVRTHLHKAHDNKDTRPSQGFTNKIPRARPGWGGGAATQQSFAMQSEHSMRQDRHERNTRCHLKRRTVMLMPREEAKSNTPRLGLSVKGPFAWTRQGHEGAVAFILPYQIRL